LLLSPNGQKIVSAQLTTTCESGYKAGEVVAGPFEGPTNGVGLLLLPEGMQDCVRVRWHQQLRGGMPGLVRCSRPLSWSPGPPYVCSLCLMQQIGQAQDRAHASVGSCSTALVECCSPSPLKPHMVQFGRCLSLLARICVRLTCPTCRCGLSAQ